MTCRTTPTWENKTDAIRDSIKWASGVFGDWKFKHKAFQLPKNNEPWFELKMGRIRPLGIDEIRNEDNIDPITEEPDVTNPRRELVCGQRQFFVEARFYGRDQSHDVVAWLIAERARARLRFDFPRDEWLKPNEVAISEMLEVVPMPEPLQVVVERIQSEAVFELSFATSINEFDSAAVGTWIESVEISSNLLNAGGVSLDPRIQMINEVLP